MRDKCRETLIIICPIARNWKAECLGSNPALDPVRPWEYFWIFLNFSFHIWKMEKLNTIISKGALAVTPYSSFFRKHTVSFTWTLRRFVLWMCLSELYTCLFRCKQENCLECSSPHCSLRFKGCIFFNMFSFQKTRWRKAANFCPHNLQVTSMEAEHTDL